MQDLVGEKSSTQSLSFCQSDSVGMPFVLVFTSFYIFQTPVKEDVSRAVAGSACQVQMLSHILSLASEKVTTAHLQRGHLFQIMF